MILPQLSFQPNLPIHNQKPELYNELYAFEMKTLFQSTDFDEICFVLF